MKPSAHVQRIASAVPPHECHRELIASLPNLVQDAGTARRLDGVIANLGIERRHSVLPRLWDGADGPGFYGADREPTTAERMRAYQESAPDLAGRALEGLSRHEDLESVTHVVFASCTGFYAPGPDLDVIRRFGLSAGVKRLIVGFMGCYAAVPALRVASDIVRADPRARVLVLCLELCSLHFRKNVPFDQLVTFLLFADGCAAAIVGSEPRGLRLDGFESGIIPESSRHMRWTIGDEGFFMNLDPRIPEALGTLLQGPERGRVLAGRDAGDYVTWAVHPGGRAILDAVESALGLTGALPQSRRVLRDFGNMSSPTVLFVLKDILEKGIPGPGCGMAFGPGLALESFTYELLT